MAPSSEPKPGELGGRPPNSLLARWKQRSFWTANQGSYFIFGLDPERASDIASAVSSDAEFEAKRVEIEQRAYAAIEAGTLHGRPSPAEFISWADSVKIAVSPRWLGPEGLPRYEGKPIGLAKLEKIKADNLRARLISLWALAPTWTIHEGAALSLDISPGAPISQCPSSNHLRQDWVRFNGGLASSDC